MNGLILFCLSVHVIREETMFSLAEELQPNAASTASTDPFTVVLTIFCDILISYVLPTSNGLDLLK